MSLQNVAAQAALEPVKAQERIQTIDVLRGFALFGILLVNMGLFHSSLYQLLLGSPWTSAADRAAQWFIHAFAEGKFYTIFSFLFGLGFALQLERAEARGARIVPTYARRLLVLLLIGLAHAILLWFGDILVTYALLGFVLLLFRKRHPRTLLVWAAILLLLPILLTAALTGLTALGGTTPEGQAMMQEVEAQNLTLFEGFATEATRIYAQGSYGEQVRQRLIDLAFTYIGTAMQMFPLVLAMFLLGLYAGKRRLFQEVTQHLPLARKALAWGLVIGLPSNLLFAFNYDAFRALTSSVWSIVGTIAFSVGAPALSMAYVAGLTLLMQREAWQRRLAPLASVGRMALTNYLLQTVVCTTIFYSYGLGLFGQVGPAAGILLTIAIYALQIPFSVWWLRRFRYGPMEWLWRTLTYGRAQPMRLPATSSKGKGTCGETMRRGGLMAASFYNARCRRRRRNRSVTTPALNGKVKTRGPIDRGRILNASRVMDVGTGSPKRRIKEVSWPSFTYR
jgi:uncharacterized protein